MARFLVAAEILESILDLPDGVELVGVEFSGQATGDRVLEFVTEGGPFPDETIVLTYRTDANGCFSLAGFTPLSL